MANHISFFAITADDVERARAFYERAFGWTFEDWGPPGFYLIHGAGLEGALQQRRAPPTGEGLRGFEMTIAVDDVHAAAAKIEEAGGRIVMQKFRIETVGDLIHFEDTEGNHVGAMQYMPR
jgi:predicted enzyme related to lactoylglutathione lyase